MSTATVTNSHVGATDVLREQAAVVHRVLVMNTAGISQEESLIQPHGGGNCLNWVVGHLVLVNDRILPLLGQKPVMGEETLRRYDRGSAELRDSGEALSLPMLLEAWDEGSKRLQAGLASLPAERLEEKAPFSPRNNPEETLRSLLTILLFHQAYHTGQTGLLRRMAGKEGAMK